MYAYLWRALPGPRWVRLLILIALLTVVFLVLMEVVFPWISAQMPYTDVTV